VKQSEVAESGITRLEEQRAVFKRSNPKFESWLQIFSCFTLAKISLEAVIVPWMRRLTSHNLQKLFTAMFTPVFARIIKCLQQVYSGSSIIDLSSMHDVGGSMRLCRHITYAINKLI